MRDCKLNICCMFQALGLRRDDAFSTTMLGNVIEALMNEVPPIGQYVLMASQSLPNCCIESKMMTLEGICQTFCENIMFRGKIQSVYRS